MSCVKARGRTVVMVDPSGPFPPMMIITPDYLSGGAIALIRHQFEDAYRGAASSPVILDGNVTVYQFVDGRWAPIVPGGAGAPGGDGPSIELPQP